MDNVNKNNKEVSNQADTAAASAHKMLMECQAGGDKFHKFVSCGATSGSLEIPPLKGFGGNGPAGGGDKASEPLKATAPIVDRTREKI